MKLSKGLLTLREDKMSKSTLPQTWTPFERLGSMMEDMFPTATNMLGNWAPLVDIKENDKELIFLAEIPGMNRENFEVELVGDTLVIRGKREEAKEEKGEGWIRKERHAGTFMRSFRLDTPVMPDKIDAQYRDGILQITIPKAEPVKTAKIAIK
jgi:HSP20 family protein